VSIPRTTQFTIKPKGPFALERLACSGLVTAASRCSTTRCDWPLWSTIFKRQRVLSLDHDGDSFTAMCRQDPILAKVEALAPGSTESQPQRSTGNSTSTTSTNSAPMPRRKICKPSTASVRSTRSSSQSERRDLLTSHPPTPELPNRRCYHTLESPNAGVTKPWSYQPPELPPPPPPPTEPPPPPPPLPLDDGAV
jgi:hypothetical protein